MFVVVWPGRSRAWGLHDNNGPQAASERKHGGQSHTYGRGYGFKNRIGIMVDMDLHAIGAAVPLSVCLYVLLFAYPRCGAGFAVDGKSFGVAFKKLPSELLYPAITIYNDRVTCRILEPKPAPTSLVAAFDKLAAKMGVQPRTAGSASAPPSAAAAGAADAS